MQTDNSGIGDFEGESDGGSWTARSCPTDKLAKIQTEWSEADLESGLFAIVPAQVTAEEFTAEFEADNAGKREPGTFVDVEAEEFRKAVLGEASPLGEAIRAFHRKYGATPPDERRGAR